MKTETLKYTTPNSSGCRDGSHRKTARDTTMLRRKTYKAVVHKIARANYSEPTIRIIKFKAYSLGEAENIAVWWATGNGYSMNDISTFRVWPWWSRLWSYIVER